MKKNHIRLTLTKNEILRRRMDILTIFNCSRNIMVRGLKLFYIRNNLNLNRIIITTKKCFKGAVKRNREKRVLREIYRKMKVKLITGFDFAFLLYSEGYSYKDRQKQFIAVMEKAGIFL